jgi:hypothetical protein
MDKIVLDKKNFTALIDFLKNLTVINENAKKNGESWWGFRERCDENRDKNFPEIGRQIKNLDVQDYDNSYPKSAIVIIVIFALSIIGFGFLYYSKYQENKKFKNENKDLKNENFQLKIDKENYQKALKDNKKNNLKTQDDDNKAKKVNFSDDVKVKLIEKIGHRKVRKEETCIIL